MKTEAYKGVLSDYAFYVKEHIAVSSLDRDHYFSTENMIPNRGGVCRATSLPEQERAIRVEAGDVLISNIRPYFKKIWLAKELAGCSNDVLCIRAKSMCLPEFLFYYLSSDTFFDYVMAGAKGTKMPRGDKQQIMHFHVLIPNLDIQKQVISILSCIDEKIQLNAQINRNLEQQAQAIFKSWFVDFEPFRDGKFVDSELGPIPEGWRIVPLDEIADFLNGLPMQKYRPATDRLGLPVLKIKELREQFCSADSERCLEDIKQEYVVEDGDVVFSWSGSLLIDIWTGGRCGLNQHLFKVTSTQHEKWFYYLWTCHHLANFIAIAADKATTMGHIQRGHIHAALTLVPSKQEYEELSAILSPIIDKMIHSRLESRRLSTLRDTLLPKLMSGEIDVSEVEV